MAFLQTKTYFGIGNSFFLSFFFFIFGTLHYVLQKMTSFIQPHFTIQCFLMLKIIIVMLQISKLLVTSPEGTLPW